MSHDGHMITWYMRLQSLFSFCAVRIVDDHAPSEPCPHGLLSDEFHLRRILRVKLKHSTSSAGLKGGGGKGV